MDGNEGEEQKDAIQSDVSLITIRKITEVKIKKK